MQSTLSVRSFEIVWIPAPAALTYASVYKHMRALCKAYCPEDLATINKGLKDKRGLENGGEGGEEEEEEAEEEEEDEEEDEEGRKRKHILDEDED